MQVVCPACGAPNRKTGKFCGACGTRLTAACPACGTPAEADQRFCDECGTPLPGSGASGGSLADVPSPPVAERRVCSVLFADLVGFTPLSEAQDPEAVRELLTRYFDTARTVIERYGGVVEKFIGDAVMAVWGAPSTTESDAERAVRAGLDLVSAVAALGAELGAAGLALRAGVVTGEMAVTLGAVGQGMVAGDAVNTAARVQSAAGPGQVWVDDTTRRLTSASVGFADEGEHHLKGKSEPMALFRATRVLAGVGGSQRVDGLEAPLIGRDAELRTIKELFHATADRKSPRLVVVSGPAGVGKTRLGWEFEKYVDGLAEVMWWHRGRCLSYGEGVAYRALSEMIRQRFGIAEEDPLDTAAAKLADLLPRFVADPAERSYVGPRLARLLGVGYGASPGASASSATLTRDELFAGWRLFFERLADSGPVVLLVEDLQHADDAALLDFFDHLIDWARTSPIYVLAFARPEVSERRPGWGIGRNRTALNLDLLDDRSLDELVDALVPGMPASAVAAIARHAQGNPLFAIETIRSLVDQDVVVPRGGQYTLVGDVRTLSVPDSLHGLLAARLDSLPPGIRELVGDAAVLGTAFPAEALLAISEQPAETVQAELAELVRREVLEISADPLSPQRGSYRFTQNMLRRVAYDTLSRRDRKARHLVVAAHLRNAFENDEIMEVVARHYLDALAAVPDDPDAGAIRSAAIEVLLRAGERAEESGAPGRAAEDFAAAADLTSQFPEAMNTVGATLWERAATAARTAGDNEKLIAYAERARNIYIEHRRERDAARAQTLLGFGTSLDGHIAQARELLADAVEVLRPSPDADTVTALRELAVLETFDGNPVSTQLTEEALVLGQALDVPDAQLADLVVSRALNYNNRGQYTEAAALYEYGVRLAERVGDTAGHARGLTGLASMKLALDPRAAADAARSAYELGKRLGARRLMAVSLTNVGWAEIFLGDWEAAGRALQAGMHADGLADDDTAASVVATLAALRGELSEGDARTTLTACRASEDPQDRCQALLVDALAAATAGRLDEALDTATEIVDHGQALGLTHELYVFGWTTAVRVAFERGDLPAVEALVARLDAHPVGHVPPLLRAERSLARARLGAARDEADADDDFTDAIAQLRAAGSPYHLAHALLDQAEFRAVTAVGPADLLLAEAAAIADRLRATPLAARAAAARAAADVPAVG